MSTIAGISGIPNSDVAIADPQCPSSLDKFSSCSDQSPQGDSYPHSHKCHSLKSPLSPTSTYAHAISSCTVTACLCTGRVKSAHSALIATFFSYGTKAQARWNGFLSLDLRVYVMDNTSIKQARTYRED